MQEKVIKIIPSFLYMNSTEKDDGENFPKDAFDLNIEGIKFAALYKALNSLMAPISGLLSKGTSFNLITHASTIMLTSNFYPLYSVIASQWTPRRVGNRDYFRYSDNE